MSQDSKKTSKKASTSKQSKDGSSKKNKEKSASLSFLGNEIITEIRRHWWGLISLYLVMGGGLMLAWLLLVLVTDRSGGFLLNSLVSLIVIIMMTVICFLAARVFWSNKLIISRSNVCQITHYTLFSSKSSVLGLANIEDVTIERKGVFAHFWRYGTLSIETAGEQDNFYFIYCPKPEECARLIMELREEYILAAPSQKLR